MDRGQIVGYKFDEKTLVVTISQKMAQKMKADGWNVHYEEELGYFLTIQQEEE